MDLVALESRIAAIEDAIQRLFGLAPDAIKDGATLAGEVGAVISGNAPAAVANAPASINAIGDLVKDVKTIFGFITQSHGVNLPQSPTSAAEPKEAGAGGGSMYTGENAVR